MTSDVFNMDCMEYMRTLPDKFFDLAIADPPYGLPARSTHGRGKLKTRILNADDIHRWDMAPEADFFDELFRVSRNQIIWGGQLLQSSSVPLLCVLGQEAALGEFLSV